MTKRNWAGRGVSLADQGLSSASNVLAVVLVARAMSADSFGVFSVAYATLVLALALSRGYFGTRISLEPTEKGALAATKSVAGALLLLAPAIAISVFGLSLFLGAGSDYRVLALVSVAAPIVCLQDALRFGAVAGELPHAALLSDLVWLAAVAVPLIAGWSLSPAEAISLWLLAAVCALVVIVVILKLRPDIRGGAAELRSRHVMGSSILYITLIGQVATLLVLAIVVRAIGPAAAGALRAASNTMMGPINVAFAFVALSLTPILARSSRSRIVRFSAYTGLGLMAGVLAWAVVVLSIGSDAGTAILGESWAGVRAVMPIVVVEYLALSWNTAATLGLKVADRSRILVLQRTLVALVVVGVGGVAAVTVEQATAVAWALVLAAAVSAGLGWISLSRPTVKLRIANADASLGIREGPGKGEA